jgi:methionyl aminopeptidase
MITIKTDSEIRIMRENGKILALIMNEVKDKVKPGIATKYLDGLAESLILKYGGSPSFKGYEGYPASLCVSVNENIVHGIPSEKVLLKEGDIVSLDLGFFKNGFHSDMAVTVPVGKISPEANRLIKTAKKSLKRGIKKAKVGNTFGGVSNAIQRCIEGQGFAVIKDLCGHGIGRDLHEDPQILNYGKRNKGLYIEKGMCFCLEPMLAMTGQGKIVKSADGFGFKTKNNSLSAHFEHMIAITAKGTEVLTELR